MAASRSEKLELLRRMIREIEEPEPADADGPVELGFAGEEAYARVIRLCSVRDRCELELRQRLAEEGFEPDEVSDAVARAVRCGLVDDMRFADARIRKLVRDGKGVGGIRRDLEARGIDLYRVPGWPEEYLGPDPNEMARALALLERRPSRSSNPARGSYQKLVQNGYSSEVAMKASLSWASAHTQR